MRSTAVGVGVIALSAVSGACGDGLGPEQDLRTRFALQALPETPYPADNPAFGPRIELGRLLFFDPILSGEKDVACATCHHPDFAFADGRALAAGTSGTGLGPARTLSASAVTGDPIPDVPRNSPTVLNAALNADESGAADPLGLQFWDGRARGLEEQARGPIASRAEMRGDAYPAEIALDSVMARLRAIPAYVERFRSAFPEEAALRPGPELIDGDTYSRAVAAYERELVTRRSPFDRYVRGEDGALSALQKRGLDLFFGEARCSRCHSGPLLSDFDFHVLGVPQQGPGKQVLPGDDTGREEHTGDPADRYAFRTPGLRNVALTAPYMHDGIFATLEEVVQFYVAGARPRHPSVPDEALDTLVRSLLPLDASDQTALVAFLESLTDPGLALDPTLLSVPDEVPSGLTPVFGAQASVTKR